MTEITHRTLDGWRLRLSGQVDLTRPGTSVAGVVVDGTLHELTAGPLGLGDEIAKASGISRFDEELHFQGGTLRIGRTIRYDAGIRLTEELLVAVWEGRTHSLVFQLYRGTTVDVLKLLRSVQIAEYDDGIVLRGAEFADRASVIKEVPGLGLLEAGPPDGKRRSRGLVGETLGNGNPYFVLAGSDTLATMVPLADTIVDEIPSIADRLRLEAVPA